MSPGLLCRPISLTALCCCHTCKALGLGAKPLPLKFLNHDLHHVLLGHMQNPQIIKSGEEKEESGLCPWSSFPSRGSIPTARFSLALSSGVLSPLYDSHTGRLGPRTGRQGASPGGQEWGPPTEQSCPWVLQTQHRLPALSTACPPGCGHEHEVDHCVLPGPLRSWPVPHSYRSEKDKGLSVVALDTPSPSLAPSII